MFIFDLVVGIYTLSLEITSGDEMYEEVGPQVL